MHGNIDRLHILLVEDDAKLARLTARYLTGHGAVVEQCNHGERGLEMALRHRFDVVLLDIMLPGMSGMEVCQRLRTQSDVPIIMITARGEEADRVMGLEIGADDYVSKPFSPRELMARIQANVRRARGHAGPQKTTLSRAGLVLDPESMEATDQGQALDLTSYEFALLYALVERAGRVLSRDQLMELARGNAAEAFDRSVDVHISRLRRKLGDDSRRPHRIRTLRGVGYQFVACSEGRSR